MTIVTYYNYGGITVQHKILTGILTDTNFKYLTENSLTDGLPWACKCCNALKFDGLNFYGPAGKRQKFQNFFLSKFCAIWYFEAAETVKIIVLINFFLCTQYNCWDFSLEYCLKRIVIANRIIVKKLFVKSIIEIERNSQPQNFSHYTQLYYQKQQCRKYTRFLQHLSSSRSLWCNGLVHWTSNSKVVGLSPIRDVVFLCGCCLFILDVSIMNYYTQ